MHGPRSAGGSWVLWASLTDTAWAIKNSEDEMGWEQIWKEESEYPPLPQTGAEQWQFEPTQRRALPPAAQRVAWGSLLIASQDTLSHCWLMRQGFTLPLFEIKIYLPVVYLCQLVNPWSQEWTGVICIPNAHPTHLLGFRGEPAERMKN